MDVQSEISGAGPLERLVREVVCALDPLEVWLFGSRAEGRARPESDWDLLVVLPDNATSTQLSPIGTWRIASAAGVSADIIPCTRSEFDEEKDEIDSLAQAAFRRGRRVY